MSNITLEEFLKSRGYKPVNGKFFDNVKIWRGWHSGFVPSFHQYTVTNGQNRQKCRKRSLGMGATLCEDWADALWGERAKIILEDTTTNGFVQSVFDQCNAYPKIGEKQEEKMYTGTVAYVPYAFGVTIDFETGRVLTGDGVRINFISAENIIPLTAVNGICNECGFKSYTESEGKKYLYLQLCVLDDKGLYNIENHLFRQEGSKTIKIELSSVEEYKKVAPVYHTGSARKPFGIDTPAIANYLYPDSVFGMSVLHRCLDVLSAVDTIFDSYYNEYVLGKKRIYVSSSESKYLDGEPFFDPSDTIYYLLPEEMKDGPYMKEVDMSIRADEHEKGLNNLLSMLSYKAGLGHDAYQFNPATYAAEMTATGEVIKSQRRQRRREKHLRVVNRAMQDLVHAIIDIGINVMGLPLMHDTPIEIDYGDSVVMDSVTEVTQMRNDATYGFIKPELYVAKRYGVNEEEARAMLPTTKDLENIGRGTP